jgi:membrane protein YqaA with SNARE-associated domain
MDALLILIAAKTPGRAYLAASLAVLGSVGGNLVLFLAAGHGVRRIVGGAREPHESQKFRAWFHRYGLISIFVPAATPILPLPLKVFVVSAGALGAPVSRFVSVIVAGRVLRYFAEAYLGVKLGTDAHHFLQRNAWMIVGIVLVLAAAFYLLIQLNERRDRGRRGRRSPLTA